MLNVFSSKPLRDFIESQFSNAESLRQNELKLEFGEAFYRQPSLRPNMGSLKKSFSVLLVLILAASILIMAKPAFAQTPTPTPTPNLNTLCVPSTPTFTITLTNTSYAVPTTYSTDPQTGAKITNAGYFVNRENLTFTIQNQPDATDYVIRYTTPYATGWSYIYEEDFNGTLSKSSGGASTLTFSGTYGSFEIGETQQMVQGYSFVSYYERSFNFESGASIEFQVQAVNGYNKFEESLFGSHTALIGVTSEWSNSQTITIPTSISPSPTPAPSYSTSTQTPTQTKTSTTVSSTSYASLLLITTIALVAIAFLLAVIIALLIYFRKRRITLSHGTDT